MRHVTDWHDAGLVDLVPGSHRVVDIAGRPVLLTRQGDRFFATDAVCPHKFAMLGEGTFGDACVTCPQHEATFSLETGQPGEGEGWAGRLPVHDVQLVNDRVQVRLTSG